MTETDFLPSQDAALVTWLNNFANVAEQDATLLKLSTTQVAEIQADASAFTSDLSDANAQKKALKMAVTTKNLSRAKVVKLVRKYNAQFQGDATLPAVVKQDLGLKIKQPAAKTSPTVPTKPVVTADALGNVSLKWNRNGNISPTLFTVEALIGTAKDWAQIGTTLAAKFDYRYATPGTPIQFRIKATRRELSSGYTYPVALYNAPVQLTLSKAA